MINFRYDFVFRLFTYEEIRRLEQLSFYDMLMCITKMEWNDIPRNPFRVPATGKEETICGNINLLNIVTKILLNIFIFSFSGRYTSQLY